MRLYLMLTRGARCVDQAYLILARPTEVDIKSPEQR